jgi:hypothetical protein
MQRVRPWVLAPLLIAALVAPSAAWASSGGDSNAGDVWLDNVGQPSGPGHETDPHLSCQNINLWGSGLADLSGTFTIDGWAPSGSQEADYGPSTWTYNQRSGRASGSQVIAVIDVQRLIAQAARNGDRPVNGQGYHFKLQVSLDPQKHKTLWVKCPAPAAQTPPSQTPSPPPAPGPQTPSPPPAPGPQAPASTSTPTSAPAPAPSHPSVHRKAVKHRRRRHHHPRHKPAPRRHRPTPTFTG